MSSVDTDILELYRRIQALEANPAGLGDIRYDFANVGDWLDIETTGTDPDGWGFHFVDSGGGGIRAETNADMELAAIGMLLDAIGITLTAGAGGLTLGATGGNADISATGTVDLTSSASSMRLEAATDIVVDAVAGDFTVTSGNDISETAVFAATIHAGSLLTLYGGIGVNVSADGDVNIELNHLGNPETNSLTVLQFGTPLFRVDWDGSIHGKASVGAITWDL